MKVGQYLKSCNQIYHLTLDPKAESVIRIHLIPPKKLKLNYVDLKNRVPSKFSELENYNFNSNKSVKTAKKNLVELIKERESLRFRYYNQP